MDHLLRLCIKLPVFATVTLFGGLETYQQEVYCGFFNKSPVEAVSALHRFQGCITIEVAGLNLHNTKFAQELVHACAAGLKGMIQQVDHTVACLDVTCTRSTRCLLGGRRKRCALQCQLSQLAAT